MGLALFSVIASFFPLGAALAAIIIYGSAFAKAILVALYFMHLKGERVLILALVMMPLMLFIILLVALLPDFVFHPTGP
jgi:caa(3)-type oxidase subunit IV